MKEKYIKLKSVLTILYSNKRIGDNGDIDPNAITEILALPTEEIEDIKVSQDIPKYYYDTWKEMFYKFLKEQNPQNTEWTTINVNSYIPEPCKTCPNHPSNGGSGICHCILGLPRVTCYNGSL